MTIGQKTRKCRPKANGENERAMSKRKQRRPLSLQRGIGCARLLGTHWIEQSGDPDVAREGPHLKVEVNVNGTVAQKHAQAGGLEAYARAFDCDSMGRMDAVLRLIVERRLIFVAVAVQEEHGKRWLEEGAQHRDFAIKVRCQRNGPRTTMDHDNKRAKGAERRMPGITRVLERPSAQQLTGGHNPQGVLEHMPGVLSDALACPHLGRGLQGSG